MSIGERLARRIRGTHVFWTAVVLAAVGYIVLGYRHTPYSVPTVSAPEEIATGTPILTAAETFDVSQFVLTSSGQTITAVRQAGGDWQITSPFPDVGDPAAIGAAIEELLGLRSSETIEQPEALSEYGLDPPQLTARLSDASGKTIEILVGDRKSTGVYYVKTSESPAIYAVGNLPPSLLDVDAFEFVAHTLLRFDPETIQRIVVRRAAPSGAADEAEPAMQLVIERSESGAWISRGGKGEPDRIVFNVDAFLEGLQYVQANDIAIAADNLGFFPAPGSFSVALTRADQSVVELNVGRPTLDQRHFLAQVTGRPGTYLLVEFVAENLRNRLNLIETSVLGVNPDAFAELTIAVGAAGSTNPVTLTRDEGSWKSADGKVAFGVATLVNALAGVQATAAVPKADPATFGFTPEAGGSQITVTLQDNNSVIFDIGMRTEDGSAVYIRSSNRPDVYLAPVNIINQISQALDDVRTSLVVFQPENVTTINVTKVSASGDQEGVTLTRTDAGWARNGTAQDAAAVTALLTALQEIGAAGIADPADEPNYKFFPAPESYRVTLTLRDGSTQILDIGGKKQVGSGWFASTNYFVRAGDLPEVGFVAESDAQRIFDAIADATGIEAPESGGGGGFSFGF